MSFPAINLPDLTGDAKKDTTAIKTALNDVLSKLNSLAASQLPAATLSSIFPKFTISTSDPTTYAYFHEYAYTPTFTGFGTCTSINFTWTRVGNRLKVMGKMTTGTVTATEARISLPGTLISDAALVPSIEVCGVAIQLNAATTFFGLYCLIESGVGYITIGAQTSVNSGQTKANGNAVSPNSQPFMVQFEIPISGWNT